MTGLLLLPTGLLNNPSTSFSHPSSSREFASCGTELGGVRIPLKPPIDPNAGVGLAGPKGLAEEGLLEYSSTSRLKLRATG